MCGIAGYITYRRGEAGESVLERMTDEIRHRGPDDHGYYRDEFACLGHRRLSIVDLSTGRQPMSNEDGSLWVVYNGEIFNHAELRVALERAGHSYRSRSDTETILHAYEEAGPACLDRFRGMFAFALWDKGRKTLFCARDRLGIKPFYYYWDGRVFVFGSEIKAILRHGAVSAAFDESVLAEYLAFGYVSDERTLFASIRKLMPGHYLTLSERGLAVTRYWDVPSTQAAGERSEDEWIRECRERLETTVRMRLMSDVPLGMFLSGGVDSSAIAAIMSGISPAPVKTFAVGYREAQYSELDYARHVAGAIGTEHHEIVVGMDDFFGVLPKLIWHEDEPLVWPSSVSLYFVSRLASEQVKVVLTGEGSDELFAGYARYRLHMANMRWGKLYSVVPARIRTAIRDAIAGSRLLRGEMRRKLQHTPLGRGAGIEELYLDNFYCAFPAASGSPYGNFLKYWKGAAGSELGRLLYADQKTYLVELLMKQDQMSMAASIESRVPFLDHPLVEFAASAPDNLKLRGSTGKYILKRAVEDLLPHDIVYRRKMGFPTPLRQWLMQPEAAPLFGVLLDREGLLARYLDARRLDDLLERHQAGLEDATDRIWRLLNLQIWGRVFLTGECGRGEPAPSLGLGSKA